MNDMIPSRRDFFDFGRRFFDDALGQNFGDFGSFKTDIIEKDDAYEVEAELPGMSKDNIELDYHDNVLSISAKQETEKDESDKERNYIRRERSSRSFSRQFIIQNIDKDNIKARFDNGVLKIDLPKQEPTAPESKRIDIE
ncbi:MAG: Hsp20/alpha crystallin family protein [Alkalibacterium sp.]|nr:Hsp20/alpha crystallin family protein [Alkalibacterium sp.]